MDIGIHRHEIDCIDNMILTLLEKQYVKYALSTIKKNWKKIEKK